MPTPSVSDILTVNMEVVRPDLPALYEAIYKDTAYSLLTKGGEKHNISKTPNGNDFRIPLKIQPPGVYAALNLDGGAFAQGSSFVTKQMYQTYFPTQMAIKMTEEQILTTDKSSLSVFNIWKESMREGLPNFQRYNDISFHNITGNQGLIALATNWVLGTLTYTFDYEFGANLLQVGMPVEIYSNDLLTQRTAGLAPGSLPYISTINKQAKTATLANIGSVTGMANTDYLGLPGAGSTPTWLNGLYYFQSTATSGNLLGLSRSTVQELIVPNVNAAGSLVPLHGTLLKSLMRQRIGTYPKKLRGLITDAQAAQIVNLGIAISEHQRGAADTAIDPVPAYDDNIKFSQVNHMIDIHASKKRIEWLDLDFWGRVYLVEPTFYKSRGDGRMVFEVRDSTGAVTTAWQFFLYAAENFYNVKPANSGFIYNLTVDPNFQ